MDLACDARAAFGERSLDETVVLDQQRIADDFYSLGLLPRAIAVQDAMWSR